MLAAELASELNPAVDPFERFAGWFAEAGRAEPADPNAMTVATVENGQPKARILLLKGLDPAAAGPRRGFVFYTNTLSPKGRQIAANPAVALLFHWKSLARQVRIEGPAEPVAPDEADAYFASRPAGSRRGAWASLQSQPLADRATLAARVAEAEARYPGEEIPRPPHWSGYRVIPARFEFWVDKPFRLHDRLLYRRDAPADPWSADRLYP